MDQVVGYASGPQRILYRYSMLIQKNVRKLLLFIFFNLGKVSNTLNINIHSESETGTLLARETPSIASLMV